MSDTPTPPDEPSEPNAPGHEPDPDAPNVPIGPGPLPPLPVADGEEGPPLPPVDLPSSPLNLTPEAAASVATWVELHAAVARTRREQAAAELDELKVQKARQDLALRTLEVERARATRIPATPGAAYLEIDAESRRQRQARRGDAPPGGAPSDWSPEGGGPELANLGPLSKLSLREQRAVEMWVANRPKMEMARELDITLATLNGIFAKPAVREAMYLQYADITRMRVERIRRLMDQSIGHFENILDQDQNAPGLPPEVQVAIIESKDKAAAVGLSRLKPFTLAELTATAGDSGFGTEDQWRRQYLQVGDVIVPHRSQRAVLASQARFVIVVAGVQSGKTFVSAILFWKRIMEWSAAHENHVKRGMFWMVAPNAIIGRIMCERFVALAPPGWIHSYHASENIWTLKDGSRVQFRSGEHADQLVADTLHGVWLDEFPICKPDVWRVSLRARIATTNGFVVFSGSPRGRNWAYTDVWQCSIVGHDKYDPNYSGHTWASDENPSIPPEEIESAKRDLPPAVYKREWQASWDAFHGQIYDDWDEEAMTLSLEDAGRETDRCERGTVHVAGIDWGFRASGCILVVRCFPDETFEVVEEIHEANRLDDWWDERFSELWNKWRIRRFWADPENAARIAALEEEGFPIMPAHNEVMPGIRAVSACIRQDRLRVTKGAPFLIAQLASYRWKDARGSEIPEAPEKGNDHALDPLRYVIFSELMSARGEEEQQRLSYGGRSLATKRGRGVSRRP